MKKENLNQGLWKTMPLGFKLIIILFLISTIENLISFSSYMKFNIIFGMPTLPPLSILVTFIYLIIPIISIYLIYKRKGWKILLGIEAFNYFNTFISIAIMILVPINELIKRFHIKLSSYAQIIVQNLGTLAKITFIFPLIISIIITSIIFIYIYKKREFFNN